MPDSRLVCYIDEAGCSGDKYGNGSSDFLSLGAVIFERSAEASIMTLFGEARAERKASRVFQKFSKSSDADNFVLTKLLSSRPVRIVQVALHKPSMTGSFTRSHHQEEYQYLCKFLIERISWVARDSAIKRELPDTTCQLIFSEQKMYPYDDLCSYLGKLQNGRDRYNSSVEWAYIHDEIGYLPHKNEHPIHLADISASALHKAIEPKMHGMTDDRFQRNLAGAIYKRNGVQYGVKLFPGKETLQMRKDGKFQFIDMI